MKIDPQGCVIDTWDVKTTDDGEEVLIHTTQQWEKKGCLCLTKCDENDYALVEFYYFQKEERSGDEGKYYLGRFTELILVHFYPQIDSAEIV